MCTETCLALLLPGFPETGLGIIPGVGGAALLWVAHAPEGKHNCFVQAHTC